MCGRMSCSVVVIDSRLNPSFGKFTIPSPIEFRAHKEKLVFLLSSLDIAEKLGVSQPTVSEHLRILSQAGLVLAKRIKQRTFYRRDEARIAEIKRAIVEAI